jgi:hypothetical protein
MINIPAQDGSWIIENLVLFAILVRKTELQKVMVCSSGTKGDAMTSANIKTMSDSQLIERVEYLVRRERELVECLIWHLQEIQDRKLYIQMGFTSLFDCLVRHFKYSEAVAYSRISALKIISAVPEAAEALNSGEVNLTTLSLTQSFIRKQEKETGVKVPAEQKVEYLQAIKNKSTQEVKQILATLSPISELPVDKIHYLDKDHAQLQATVCKTLLDKIEKLKALISHENIDPSYNELLHLAFDAAIEKADKKRGIKEPLQRNPTGEKEEKIPNDKSITSALDTTDAKNSTRGFSIKSSRYISREVKRIVSQTIQQPMGAYPSKWKKMPFKISNAVRSYSSFQ